MAGRPRTMLRRVCELERRADELGANLYDLTPKKYLERPDNGNPVCTAWQNALTGAANALNTLAALKDLLKRKVDLLDEKAADGFLNSR